MARLRVRELAQAQGLTISDLHRRADMAYTTMHALWHGTSLRIDLETLDRLAWVLDVQVPDLFIAEPPSPPPIREKAHGVPA